MSKQKTRAIEINQSEGQRGKKRKMTELKVPVGHHQTYQYKHKVSLREKKRNG